MKTTGKVYEYNYKRVMVTFNMNKAKDAALYKYISGKNNNSQTIKDLIKKAIEMK